MFKRFLYLLAALAVTGSSFAQEQVIAVPSGGAQTSSKGLVNKLQAVVGKGTFGSVLYYSTNVAAQYIQIHLGATAPAGGAVPEFVWKVPADGYNSLVYPVKSDTGVWVVNSTTRDTYTAGAADCWFYCTRYK